MGVILSEVHGSVSIWAVAVNTLPVLLCCVVMQVHPEGKFVVDLDKSIDMADVQANCRVALKNDSYKLHKILPNKVPGVWSEVWSGVSFT